MNLIILHDVRWLFLGEQTSIYFCEAHHVCIRFDFCYEFHICLFTLHGDVTIPPSSYRAFQQNWYKATVYELIC